MSNHETESSEELYIRDFGKFENCPRYIPAFYDHWGDGAATATGGDSSEGPFNAWAMIEVCTDDVTKFPELANVFAVYLEESETGFVYCILYVTEDDMLTAIDNLEFDEMQYFAEQQARDEHIRISEDRLAELQEQETGRCEQCEVCMVQGVRCHEIGCEVLGRLKDAKAALERAYDDQDGFSVARETNVSWFDNGRRIGEYERQ